MEKRTAHIKNLFQTTLFQASSLLVAVPIFFVYGKDYCWATVYGILLAYLPHTYFSFKVFKQFGASYAQSIVKNLYLGEIVKLALIASGFCLGFKVFPSSCILVLLIAFILEQIIIKLTSFWLGKSVFKLNRMIKHSKHSVGVKNYGK